MKYLGKHEDFEYKWNNDGIVTCWSDEMGMDLKIVDPNHINMLIKKNLLEPKPTRIKSDPLKHVSEVFLPTFPSIIQQQEAPV